MAYCQHGYPCANPACLLRLQAAGIPLPGQQESLLVQGVVQTLPAPPLFPGSNANGSSSQQQGNPPGYPQQQRSSPDPGHWSTQPPIYSHSHPVHVPPHAPPPSHPQNTYYPPNPCMQYAAHGPGQAQPPFGVPLPPWLGNNQPAPMPYLGFATPRAVVGPPAPMPIGGYTPGSQHPHSIFASHPSNRQDPRPDPNRPVQTASGGWLLPDESPGVPHAWLRGGGDDQDPQEQGTDEEGAEADAEDAEEGAHRAFQSGHCCRKLLTGPRLSSTLLDHDEDDWLFRQGQAHLEEDLRQAAQPQSVSPQHVMIFRQPDSTDVGHNSRSTAADFQPSAGHLSTGVVKECHSLHRSSSIRQPLVSQSRASKISTTYQKSNVTKKPKAANGPRDLTFQSHGHVSVGAEPSQGNCLRGGNSEIQRASSDGISRRQEAIPNTSTLPTPSYQPRTPPTRLLYLSREGRLYDQVRQRVGDPRLRVFDASALNYAPFTNHPYAHEDQISPDVLDHLGIPYEFHEQNPHWVVVRVDVTNELLRELLDRSRVRRNYAGQCSDGPVGLDVLASARGNVSAPRSLSSDRFWATVLDPAPADASGIRGGAGSSEYRNRPADSLPIRNTSGIWREYRLSRTGQLIPGRNQVSEVDYRNSARPICINADRRDLLPRILDRAGLQYREFEDNRLEVYGYIPSVFLRSLLEQSRVADAGDAEAEEKTEDAEEGEHTGEDKDARTKHQASDPAPLIQAQTGGNGEARLRGGASGTIELQDQLDEHRQAYPGGYERITQPEAPQTSVLNLTINLSTQDEDRELINPESLATFPDSYDIGVNQHTISRLILAELGIPHYFDHADPQYLIITGSIPVDLIEILAHETRLRFRHVAYYAAVEAQRLRVLESEGSDGSLPGETSTRRKDRQPEDHGHKPLTHGHLRGGASSPEGSQSVSPLSPRRRPRERSHEYNRRRLQYDMEIRSRHRANEDREREHHQSSDPDADEPEDDPEPQDSFDNTTRQRRNAVDLGSPLPWAPEREAPWVLEQEAAHMYRNAPLRGAQRSTPRHEYGPHGLTNGARPGNGDSSDREENVPFPHQPRGQEARLWDAILFTIPAGGWLNVTRENSDSLFAWRTFDASGQEVGGGERNNPRAVGSDAGGRAHEGVMGVIFAEEGAGGGPVEVRVAIGRVGGEELMMRGRPVDRIQRGEEQ